MEYESGFDAKQQEILSRNPLLRVFLDPSAETTPFEWANKLFEEKESVTDKISEKFGRKQFLELAVLPQLSATIMIGDVFLDNELTIDNINTVEIIQAIGFQIGDMGETFKFRNQIVKRLIQMGSVKIPTDYDQLKKVNTLVWWILSSGVTWSHYDETKNLPKKPAEIKKANVAPLPGQIELPTDIENFLDSLLKPKDPPEENK